MTFKFQLGVVTGIAGSFSVIIELQDDLKVRYHIEHVKTSHNVFESLRSQY